MREFIMKNSFIRITTILVLVGLIACSGRDSSDGRTVSVRSPDGKNIITPAEAEGALGGITAAKIIEAAAEENIQIQRQRIDIQKLLGADEVFATNSIIDIVPIVKIDDKKIGSGKPGPTTRKLMAMYRQFCKR